MATRREVRITDDFMFACQRTWEVGGSADGDPPLEMFLDGPVKGVLALLARQFDALPEIEGTRFRVAATYDGPVFTPMLFYARLAGDGTVELVDFTVDGDYLDSISDDPS